MNILILNSSNKPIYEQIITQFKEQILNGSLSEGELLPSIRNLASELRISVITTKRAYDELEKEHYIETVRGKGSYVSAHNKELMREKKMKNIEDKLIEAIKECKIIKLSQNELKNMIDILYEET
jgi:GntR family transcriptional regulator